jgi:hypothetical protein
MVENTLQMWKNHMGKPVRMICWIFHIYDRCLQEGIN